MYFVKYLVILWEPNNNKALIRGDNFNTEMCYSAVVLPYKSFFVMEFIENKWYNIPEKEGYQIGMFDGEWKIKSLERIIINNNRHLKIKEKLLKLLIIGGYLTCSIGRLYKLIAITFIDNPNNYKLVRHLNDIKIDNRIENLKRGTISDNNKDAYINGKNIGRLGQKCTEEAKNKISKYNKGKIGKLCKCSKKIGQYTLSGEFVKEWYGANEIKRELGINNIFKVIIGIRNHAGGFKRKYI